MASVSGEDGEEISFGGGRCGMSRETMSKKGIKQNERNSSIPTPVTVMTATPGFCIRSRRQHILARDQPCCATGSQTGLRSENPS
jgi:hypothetical protein